MDRDGRTIASKRKGGMLQIPKSEKRRERGGGEWETRKIKIREILRRKEFKKYPAGFWLTEINAKCLCGIRCWILNVRIILTKWIPTYKSQHLMPFRTAAKPI